MIETKHKDYRVLYSEDSDIWECGDLCLKAKTLKALRGKIDQIDLDARRVDNVKAFKIQSYGGGETPCVVTLREGNNFWIAYKGRREKVSASEIVLDTPENRAAIEKYREAVKAAGAARAHQEAMNAAIPRGIRADVLGTVPTGVDGEKGD